MKSSLNATHYVYLSFNLCNSETVSCFHMEMSKNTAGVFLGVVFHQDVYGFLWHL